MRQSACLLSVLFVAQLYGAPPQLTSAPGYVGSTICAQCHQAEFEGWQNSHHDLAMQEPAQNTVLGDFNNATFSYNNVDSRFFRKGSEYWVSTDGPDGRLADYQVQYVFGVSPLQQYLLALPRGRLQALSIAWDSRPTTAGGQRWFHLYPDRSVTAADPLHWTGLYQNWNSRCAECHSTNLQRNFDSNGTFSTTWTALNVGCEACHGPGGHHVQIVTAGQSAQAADLGLPVHLAERGQWQFHKGSTIAQGRAMPRHSQQVDSCGRCHSRRDTLGEYQYGRHLLDTHRLSLLEPLLYHPDGQIKDEVYVYGSFIQSKMYQAGVVCSNCHDPHSNNLRAPGNAVCGQCHKADVYDDAGHHHHQQDSAGSLCVNCHMPATTYMAVDPRRDHSLRIPRPDLSVVLGTPNACNQCHQGKSPGWALNSLHAWGIGFDDTDSHPARAMQQARLGNPEAMPRLREIATNPAAAAIGRASAMVELGRFATPAAYQTARQLLASTDPLLRMAAVRSLEYLPPEQRWRVLNSRLGDASRAVRMELARMLAGVTDEGLTATQQRLLHKLFKEYLALLNNHADMPSMQLQLGVFFTARRRPQKAEAAYRNALQLHPQLLAAQLHLADLYRAQSRDDEARPLLQEAIASAPEQGIAHHALGLLETRQGNKTAALAHLQRAAELEHSGIRYRYVYAIALHDEGDTSAAILHLKTLHRLVPKNPDILLALLTYHRDSGRTESARRYARLLRQLVSDNPHLHGRYDGLE